MDAVEAVEASESLTPASCISISVLASGLWAMRCDCEVALEPVPSFPRRSVGEICELERPCSSENVLSGVAGESAGLRNPPSRPNLRGVEAFEAVAAGDEECGCSLVIWGGSGEDDDSSACALVVSLGVSGEDDVGGAFRDDRAGKAFGLEPNWPKRPFGLAS